MSSYYEESLIFPHVYLFQSISPGAVRTEMFDSAIAILPQLKQMPALKAEDVADSIIHALTAPPHVEIHEITLVAKSLCE